MLGDVLCSSQCITQLISNLIGREWSFFVFCLYFAFYPRHTLLIMPQYIAGIVNLTVHMPVSSKLSLWSFMLIFCQLIGPVSVSSVFFNLVSVLPLDLLLLLSDWSKNLLIIALLCWIERFICLKANRWQISSTSRATFRMKKALCGRSKYDQDFAWDKTMQ